MRGLTWRHAPLLIAALPVTAAVAQQAPPAIDSLSEQDYDIPAQPLDQALESYARISGVDLINAEGLTAGRRSAAVKGRLTRQAALRALLEGSGVLARFAGPRSVVLFRIGTQPPVGTPAQGAPSLQLDMAEVRARPTISGTNARAIQAYGDAAWAEIRSAIARDPKLRHETFQLDLTISIDAEGRIANSRMSGDAADIGRLRTVIDGLKLSLPPPDHKRIWLRFIIAANAAASRERSAK